MTAVIVVLVLTGIAAGLVAAAGAGLFALILVPVGLAVAVWLALAGGTRTGPREVARREASKPELLGPGGPDDPTADR
jgi:hypothetical protein